MNQTEKVATKGKMKGCLKSIFYAFTGFFVLLLIIGFCTPESELQESKVQSDPYIKGLDPSISNLALKEYGFKTNRDFSGEGKFWTAERDDWYIKYSVTMFSPDDHKQVTSFRLVITVEPGYENISKGKWMMKELSGVKYDGSDHVAAYNWVEQNYNNDKSFIDIGGVRFTINAPSDYVRMLNINKINPETGDIFY